MTATRSSWSATGSASRSTPATPPRAASSGGSSLRGRICTTTTASSSSPTSTTPGPDGDRLVATTYIQRIATTGGLAPPAVDCNAATAGTVAEVPYTADYYFWKHTDG